jgi:Na+/citrate or Na+/malate symporter
MDYLEWYKYLVKTKVIVSIGLVYVSTMFFTIYIDAFLSSQILGNYDLHNIHQLFPFHWWKILLIGLIQTFVLCFLYGLIVGLKRAIVRNKGFFLS